MEQFFLAIFSVPTLNSIETKIKFIFYVENKQSGNLLTN